MCITLGLALAAVCPVGIRAAENGTADGAAVQPGNPGVRVTLRGRDVEIRVDGRLFTRYDTTTDRYKPYFYPVNDPLGRQVVRHWPVEPVATETHDHPHHRGLWFSHGAVNGIDFWTEGPGRGRTVARSIDHLRSGPTRGGFVTTTDWLAPDGRRIASDVRTVAVTRSSHGIFMDLDIVLSALADPVVLGDTKEGTLGFRVADSMRPRAKSAGGQILNSRGDQNGAAWGKRAEWCDYTGPVESAISGVTMFDHPSSFRHATPWHVRDYGLFAINPFGFHDFFPADRSNPHAGDFTLRPFERVRFSYRLWFHAGSPSAAEIDRLWRQWASSRRVDGSIHR